MKLSRLRLVALFAVVLTAGFFVVHPAVIHQVQAQVNTGLNFASGTGLSNQDIRITIARIIRIILGFLGIIAVGLIMYAGFIWMNSGGNEEKVTQAKLILRNAAIGLIIILASFAIVSFIIGQLTGATTGQNQGNGTGEPGGGIGALGNGIVKSVYPEPFQRDVPRNTSIIVTFREPMLASSICDVVTSDSPAKCAPTAKAKPLAVKIYKTTVGDVSATNLTNVSVASIDNMTFVFRPAAPSYLGSPIESTDYTVKLTSDIQKNDGSSAFNLSDFHWSFQVSNILDLTSPQIKSISDAGIFPLPDDEADVVSGITQATQASGTITVAGKPNTYQAASADLTRTAPPPFTPIKASLEGTNQCADGGINIVVNTQGNTLGVHVGYSQAGLLSGDLPINNNRVVIAPCGLTLVLEPGFAAGYSWHIETKALKQSDTLTVGSKIYSFVNANPNANQIVAVASTVTTAQNIANAINVIHPEVIALDPSASIVTVKAKVAGVSGNSLELSSSNPVALALSRMQGGSDQTTTFSVKGSQDQPKNSVIQINFNEAVNPLTASGTSDDLANKLEVVNADAAAKAADAACTQNSDCRSYTCSANKCVGNQLGGSFAISNQYKTVEFISNLKCGVNGCGENIYCLPGNSNLKVDVTAASLQSCTTNADCTVTPFTTCTQGVCNDSGSHKNYPTAPVENGIVDLADNSLDGNRNDNPQGQADTYDENKTVQNNGGHGDNYLWSFWINDRLDLTPPIITHTSVNNNQPSVNLTTALEIVFSKIMMSASLATGNIVIDNGINKITHKLINLWSLANDPVGYWVSKEDRDVDPLDGHPDRTSAILGHGVFNDSTLYQTQIGSGVKDIYQNCYKPSVGPGCGANALQPSCCRDTNGNLVPTATLTPDGNCP